MPIGLRVPCSPIAWSAPESSGKRGQVNRILVSGDHGSAQYDEVNAMHDWLLRAGVPDRVVYLDHAGFRTLDTMQRAARVFGVQDALVCSQAVFLPRAVFLARAAGMRADGVVADRHEYTHSLMSSVRERIAVAVAVVESALGHGPRYLGPHIDLTGPAIVTHDR